LRNFGAIAPRFWADFIVFDDLQKFSIRQTYKKGVLVADQGKYLGSQRAPVPQPRSTMNLRYAPRDLQITSRQASKIRVIEIVPNQIVTRQIITSVRLENGQIVPDVERDILKLVVVERHHSTGNVGVGFVRGFKLKSGALGSTVAHDAHNVIVVGTNDADIIRAIEQLQTMQGGQVAVNSGIVLAELSLSIAGLVSRGSLEEVIRSMADLNDAANQMGCDLGVPFMALSFLSLSPIPELKLTDQGLIDSLNMRTTSVVVD